MENFTPFSGLLGGALIGLAASALLYFNGRVAGISGIFGGLLQARRGDTAWRASFVGGLVAGGVALAVISPASLDIQVAQSAPAVLLAGLLVGLGTRMGSGCTSGHGVCGIGRLAPRSIIATGIFLLTGAVTATLVSRLMGGAI